MVDTRCLCFQRAYLSFHRQDQGLKEYFKKDQFLLLAQHVVRSMYYDYGNDCFSPWHNGFYVIYSPEEQAYWNNEWGWVDDAESADTYSEEEVCQFEHLPKLSVWVPYFLAEKFSIHEVSVCVD